MSSPERQKDKSSRLCNDGEGQGRGSAGRKQMSLIKINHAFLVNINKKRLLPKLITLDGVKLASSHSSVSLLDYL